MNRTEKIRKNWLKGYDVTKEKEAYQMGEDIDYIFTLVPKELKHKKEFPTVIEYKGKRYVYDPNN